MWIDCGDLLVLLTGCGGNALLRLMGDLGFGVSSSPAPSAEKEYVIWLEV